MFNRSFPILTRIPTFERLPRDPRPISHDLEMTHGLSGSRDLLQQWLQLLKRWHVPPHKIEYRFLLAFNPKIAGGWGARIIDQMNATPWLQKTEDRWNGRGPGDNWFEGGGVSTRFEGQDENYIEDIEKAVRPVFGFWLFPLEALACIEKNGLLVDEEPRPRGEEFRNMTENWPKLTVSMLP